MVYYTINLEGIDEDIQCMVEIMAEIDDNFEGDETEKEYDVMEEGNEELEKDDLEQMAIDMANHAPNASFIIKGEEDNHGYLMAFELIFRNKELISRCSDWYTSYVCCSFNYENYEEFCESTGLADRVSEEQFNSYMEQETEIVVLNSGDVATRDAIPMSSEKIDWEGEDFDEEE